MSIDYPCITRTYIFILAGRIDHGNHYNQAKWALEDTLAFDEAITKAIELTNEEDTLMIVTGDHSSSINLGGFSSINNPILGNNGPSIF